MASKTVIQGLEPGDYNMGGGQSQSSQSIYSRGASAPARGTIVPGMNVGGDEPSGMPQQGQPAQQTARRVQTGKPVVGFLYSVSRTPLGEYWPLQIGRNTIGQSETCDIVLPEATVTGEHAVMVIRQIKNTGGVIAAITDTQSTNGTMINGETIGFSAVECHNNDIITIGNNYELVLVLMDAAKLGLTVSKDFIPVEVQHDDPSDAPYFDPMATRAEGFNNPYGSSWGGDGGYRPTDGTVGIDGSAGNNHGGTISM